MYPIGHRRAAEAYRRRWLLTPASAIDPAESRHECFEAGTLHFAGTVSEPATVNIQGRPALVDATNGFSGTAITGAGTTTVTIQAVDPSGNVTNVQYDVTLSGTGRTFSYDANGNLTADGKRTFEWDARNQLVAVNVGAHRSEFTYDGLKRRVRIVEKENGITQSDIRSVWGEQTALEDRDADGTTVNRRMFQLGEQVAAAARFFATDHVGSVSELTGSSGTLLARYQYDPWGRRTVSVGTNLTDAGFGELRQNEIVGLSLARHRAYDAELGRWISEDPIGFAGGVNVYGYVENAPVSFVDPQGLLRYKSGVPNASGELKEVLECTERCFGKEFTITSTHEATPSHPVGTPHRNGHAADVRYPGAVDAKTLLCCSSLCLAGFAQDEAANPSSKSTAPHLHIQVTSGRRPGYSSGDLPPECRPDLTCPPPDGSRKG
jgi:RHS repeat-associated protein